MNNHPSLRTNRRKLLTALGTIPLAFGASRYLRAAERQDVIILGAGLSGLYSAMLLEEQGFNVTLLEASDHVGGRVQTRTLDGVRHELGASDIGVMYARVLDMMNRLNLKRVPSALKIKPYSYHVNDQLLNETEWASADANQTAGDEREIAPSRLQSHLLGLHNPLENLDDWLLPQHYGLDIPIAQYLTSQGVSDEAIRLFGHSYNGTGMNRTSALSLFRDTTRTNFGIKAFMQMKAAGQQVAPLSQVAGGNQRLPEAMAASLKTEIRFSQAAAAIFHDTRGVEVTCNDGSRYRGDFLVSAIPLTALRRIEITPTLSADKAAIVHQMEYYAVSKFYLRPKTKFWETDGYDASMWTDGPVERVFAGTDENDEVHSLLVWITGQGSRRIDQMGREAATRFVLDTLARIRPASRGQLEVLGYHSWGKTPYLNGCGHSYSAGQIERYAANLPAPEGRIHFAGEHTRRREFGMEAAMASAERVLSEILQVT
ncbi:MAG: FAD-dependent oxidoreductase [Gammaproteobacteria bacterium]|jgi:monoamine oxidase|nr:hypothetical protein [Chromatiales bacterium]MDP6674042.1 FAD-dependent oxidoreductase [Gammaproteobacteria bacterium]